MLMMRSEFGGQAWQRGRGGQARQRGQLMLMMHSEFGGPSPAARAADAHVGGQAWQRGQLMLVRSEWGAEPGSEGS